MCCSVVHMTKPASPKYTVGQRVEVLATDFQTPGFPGVWELGMVTAVEPWRTGRWYVEVARNNGGSPIWHTVGTRDGNKYIKAL